MIPSPDKCPANIVNSLINFRDHGVSVGGFLYAVLSNQLIESFARADHINIKLLPHIVSWVYHNMPMDCYGSERIVNNWIDKKHIERMRQNADRNNNNNSC